MHNIPLFKVYMSPKAIGNTIETLSSGFIGEGPKVKEFENSLKNFFKVNNSEIDIVATNSATSAEHLFYSHFKKERSDWEEWLDTDEVLSSPLTCTATNLPIVNEGLKLKWVDVDPITCNICLDDLQKKIDKNTRIITLVHWGGNPVDIDKLSQIVEDAKNKYGRQILVLEDCAHSFGSMYKNKAVGFTGNYATFSFQAIKHITTGDGGILVSPNSNHTKDFKLKRWYGIDRDSPRADFRCEQDIKEAGFKYHMNDIAASIGLANLDDSDWVLDGYRKNAAFYDEHLQVRKAKVLPGAKPAYWLYTIFVEDRDKVMKYLTQKGIHCSRVHERNDIHTCFNNTSHLPGVDKAVAEMLCIPVGWWVTELQLNYIVKTVNNAKNNI